MPSEGTLVVMVASRDGLVLASDGRHTVGDGIYCDGVTKFLEPAAPDRLVLALTGRRGIYPLSMLFAADPCEYVRKTPREFDLAECVKDAIERDEVFDLATADLSGLATACGRSLAGHLRANQYNILVATKQVFSSSVLHGQFDPVHRVAIIRSFEIEVTPRGESLSVVPRLNERFTQDDLAEPIIAGEFDYLTKHVLPNLHHQPIAETTRSRIGNFPQVDFRKVADTPLSEAVDMVTDLIESASRMTTIIPAPSGIGGPLDVRFVGEDPRPIRLR